MTELKAFKVVNAEHGVYKSFLTGNTRIPSEIMDNVFLEYKVGEITKPRFKNLPLYLFESFDDAYSFRSVSRRSVILEGVYTPFSEGKPPFLRWNDLGDFSACELSKIKYNMDDELFHCPMPKGSVCASSFLPTKILTPENYAQ
jgi:hypothetical protein